MDATSTNGATRPSRREEILIAAAKVIAERGFKEATVRDIGEAAGILSGSLYYHFESKEHMVLDMLLPSVSAQHEVASELAAGSESQTDALEALIRSSVLTTATNPHRAVILRNSGRTFEEFELLAPIAELRRESLRLWRDVIAKGIANGEFRDDIDATVAVHGILDGVLGAARWFIEPMDEDPDHIAESLNRMYVSGLTRS